MMTRRALPPGQRLLALPPAPQDRNPPRRTHAPLVLLLGFTLAGQSLLDGSRFIESYFNASLLLSMGFLFVVFGAGWIKSFPVAVLVRNWFALGAWTFWASIGIFAVKDPMTHFKWLVIVWVATTAAVVFGALAVCADQRHVANALLIANAVWITANLAMVPAAITEIWTSQFSGAVLNRNAMAVNCLILIGPLLYYLRFLGGTRRRVAWVLVALSSALVFLTLSRKGVAGLAFVFLCYGLFAGKGVLSRVIAVLVVVAAAAGLLISHNPFSDRVTYADDPGAEAVDIRFELATGGLKVGAENAWLGVGLGHSEYYFGTYTHNNYVELFMASGAIGLILYYAPLLWFAWRLALWRKRDHLWALAGVLLAWKLLINDLGVVSYNGAALIYSLAWVGAVALRRPPPLLPETNHP